MRLTTITLVPVSMMHPIPPTAVFPFTFAFPLMIQYDCAVTGYHTVVPATKREGFMPPRKSSGVVEREKEN
jgi:hypothetical protein